MASGSLQAIFNMLQTQISGNCVAAGFPVPGFYFGSRELADAKATPWIVFEPIGGTIAGAKHAPRTHQRPLYEDTFRTRVHVFATSPGSYDTLNALSVTNDLRETVMLSVRQTLYFSHENEDYRVTNPLFSNGDTGWEQTMTFNCKIPIVDLPPVSASILHYQFVSSSVIPSGSIEMTDFG